MNLDSCFTLGYEDAQERKLMKITGVGKKVADCTLLFGMHRIEAFPIDVWMKRAMEKLFPNMNGDDFGQYAGIAPAVHFSLQPNAPRTVLTVCHRNVKV